jgi:hypothetical protein
VLAHRVLSCALIAAFLCVPTVTQVIAADAKKIRAKIRKKAERAPNVLSSTGARSAPDAKLEAPYGGAKIIKEYTNELGQKVHWIGASHFDISPPLREMAAGAVAERRAGAGEPSEESSEEPTLPSWRILRSDVPDPVVQAAVQPADAVGEGGVPLAAPTMGFNFQGMGFTNTWPPDSNGAVGGNQFVETVNAQYQVWSLNRTTMVATSVLGPANFTTLWTGFGPCELPNNSSYFDPVVIFDKTARRWLITTLGAAAVQCVAVSTSADATGTYARYAFPFPPGVGADYAKFSTWPTVGYLFTGHANSLFGAMDRTKMLAGDPTATWVLIEAPNEWGQLPADLDGFALPPTLAPGVFVSIRPEGMRVHRLRVSFSTGVGTLTLQATVPVAPFSAACGNSSCIPQPGTGQTLATISDRLMFRAAYRNLIDHESLVVSHAVDPSVSGVQSGVRWYDLRLSGSPDATCPTYPCMYQQGTLADVPDGRSRWMSSIAMDTAESILMGYTTSGKTAGSENHSSRYTGRAKGDPPGLMTVPETTIVTGTANNSNSRWGDYHSMSSDPADDCTFWFVSQYYATEGLWSTRIASAVFPPGTGPGQCPVTTCNTRPFLQPTGTSASVPGNNQITVSWTGITPAPGAYAIERAQGACSSSTPLYRPLAAVPGTSTSFTDTTVQGGIQYSYRVRAAADAAGKCQAVLAGACANATATGTCSLKPTFGGATSATGGQDNNCGVTVSWTPASSSCPLTPGTRYNIFRGTVPDFVPTPANRIATCVMGSSYLDSDNLQGGMTYYYTVRAEDMSTGNGGACGGGNEDANSVVVSGTPYGAGIQPAPGTWTDGGGDGNAFAELNVVGGGNAVGKIWRFVKTADDPGANHTPGGAYAYRNAGPAPGNTYAPGACAELRGPAVIAAGSTVNLQYWERHQLEYLEDGVAVEYSVNAGAWNDVPPASNSEALGCAASDETTGLDPLICRQFPTCGFNSSMLVFTGPSEGGTTCDDFSTSGTVGPYAHRCHPITGLSADDSIRFRWRFSSDNEMGFAGFYLDDIAVTNVRLPNACAPDTCAAQPNGTSCDDGDPCTAGDTCGSGVCTSGSPIIVPPETNGMSVAADKATYSWSMLPSATRYDVVRGSIGALPVGPGGGDETCFTDLASPMLADSTLPAPASGFWYLSRGENPCGTGPYGLRHDGNPRVTTTCP